MSDMDDISEKPKVTVESNEMVDVGVQSEPGDNAEYQYDQTQPPLPPIESSAPTFVGSGEYLEGRQSEKPQLSRLARSQQASSQTSIQNIQKLKRRFSLSKSPSAANLQSGSGVNSDSSVRNDTFSAQTQREIQSKGKMDESSNKQGYTQQILNWLFMLSMLVWLADTIFRIIMSPTQANHWVFIYIVIQAGFYMFTTPFRDQLHRGEMSYFSFSQMYAVWLQSATIYRQPSFSMFGINTQLSISIFQTVLLATSAFLLLCHGVYMALGLLSYFFYPSFAQRKFAPKRILYNAIGTLEFWEILTSSVTIALFCTLTHSHCESTFSNAAVSHTVLQPELAGNGFYTAVYLMQPLPELTCPNPDVSYQPAAQPFLPSKAKQPVKSSIVTTMTDIFKYTVRSSLGSLHEAYPNQLTQNMLLRLPRVWHAIPNLPSIEDYTVNWFPWIDQNWAHTITGDICRSLSRVPHNSLATFSLPFALYVDRQPKLETDDYALLFQEAEKRVTANAVKKFVLTQPYSFTNSISMYPEFNPEMAIPALLAMCQRDVNDAYCVHLQKWVHNCENTLKNIIVQSKVRVSWEWTCPVLYNTPLLMLLAGSRGGQCLAESQIVMQNYVLTNDHSIVDVLCHENTQKQYRVAECRFRPFEPATDKSYSYSSPVWQLWLTLVVIYIVNYVFTRSASWALSYRSESAESYRLQQLRKVKQTVGLVSVPTPEVAAGTNPMGYALGHHTRQISPYDHTGDNPRFLPMVSWFSVTSWDIWQSAFDILVSFKLFLGRFDRRTVISNHVHANSLFDMTNTETQTKGSIGEMYMIEKQKTRDLAQLLAVQAAAVADLQILMKRMILNNRIRMGQPATPSDNDDTLEMIDLSPLHSLVDDEAQQLGEVRPEQETKPLYDGATFTDYADAGDLWFDWVADVGDGGDSAYCVGRQLAQPYQDLDVPADEAMYEHVKDLFVLKHSDGSHSLDEPPEKGVPAPEGMVPNAADMAFYPPEPLARRSLSGGATTTKCDQLYPEPIMESAYANKTQPSPMIDQVDIKRNFANVQQQIRRVLQYNEGGVTTKKKERIFLRLPRARILVCGGDLAYPNPTNETYDERFLLPLEYSQPPPATSNVPGSAHAKPFLPPQCKTLKEYPGPTAFIIPGNHDWFDGLDCFMRYICNRHWLAGWLLPQKNSYFALALPKGVWLWAVDQGLNADIDAAQFAYFEHIALKMGPSDRAIVCTHEPTWLLAWHAAGREPVSLLALLHSHLKGRCVIRLAGDVHQYLRHSLDPTAIEPTPMHRTRSTGSVSGPSSPVYAKSQFPLHCIVSGGGGAFLHPTHPFYFPQKHEGGQVYTPERAYPSVQISKSIAVGNLVKFRKKNWQFDVVAGLLYLAIIFSVIPQCSVTDYYTAAPLAFLAAVPQHLLSPSVFVNPIDKLALLANSTPNTPPFGTLVQMQCSLFDQPSVKSKFVKPEQSLTVQSSLLKAIEASQLNPPMGPYAWLDPPAQNIPSWAQNHYIQAVYLIYVLTSRHIKQSISVLISLFARSTFSAFVVASLYLICYVIVPKPLQGIQKLTLGASHATLHIFTAISLAIIFEASIELASKAGLVGNAGIHELFDRYKIQEELMFPDLQALRSILEQYSLGIYPAMIKWVMTLFDVSNFYAISRSAMCNSCATFMNLSHFAALGYYAAFFVYYWVLVTPICSFIIGCYLYISLNVFNVHWDEGFSSLRIMHYKSFLRFRIDKKGDIHVFCLGIDRTPKKWIEDPLWWRAGRKKFAQGIWGTNGDMDWGSMAYGRQRPSRWKPAADQPDKVKIIDYFCIKADGSTFSAKEINHVNDSPRMRDEILDAE